MARWLLKTEPGCYSWSDLERDRKTTWDGVTNALALKHIRSMSKGDDVPVPEAMWDRLLQLAKGDGGGDNGRAAAAVRSGRRRSGRPARGQASPGMMEDICP